jgi:hypothetical protein
MNGGLDSSEQRDCGEQDHSGRSRKLCIAAERKYAKSKEGQKGNCEGGAMGTGFSDYELRRGNWFW